MVPTLRSNTAHFSITVKSIIVDASTILFSASKGRLLIKGAHYLRAPTIEKHSENF